MIFSYAAKAFNDKMRKQLLKIWKKKRAGDFSTLSINYMKKQIFFLIIKIHSNSQNITFIKQA